MTRTPSVRLIPSVVFVAAIAACAITASLQAADPAAGPFTVSWKERADAGLVPNGEAVELTEQRPFATAHALKVVSEATTPVDQARDPVILIATIENPPIAKQHFALNGWIQHQGVEGNGYLEMWVVFPDGSRFFARTLEVAGPLQSLSGDSDWRRISLPFQMSDDPKAPQPSELIVNAVLPGAGEVMLSDLTLTEADNLAAVMKPEGAWWTDRMGGLIGGLGGSFIGLMGAVIGVMAGLGRGRAVVNSLLIAMTGLGPVLLLAGIVALALGQPYGVYYPLLLGGCLCTMLGIVGLVVTRQRFEATEMRRMQALDA